MSCYLVVCGIQNLKFDVSATQGNLALEFQPGMTTTPVSNSPGSTKAACRFEELGLVCSIRKKARPANQMSNRQGRGIRISSFWSSCSSYVDCQTRCRA
uniref:Uncharacterized protein n=1 Tax=Mesocestoides corti TaxID=53468 RepID=A0A5K3G2U6_MESCO